MRYLIFDFDGVLGDTSHHRIEVVQEMEGKTREEVIILGDQYCTESPHTRSANVSAENLQAMKEWNKRFGTLLANKNFELFGGFIEELKKITTTKMAIVSSGSSLYIKPSLENCGLKFSHILTFEDHHSKEEKVENICRDWNIPLSKVYFFTDTISDVVELKGMLDINKIYGCAWGYQGREKLEKVLRPEYILDNFADIQKIFH